MKNSDELLHDLTQGRQQEVTPERDLWPGIEARIQPAPGRRISPKWSATAAAALITIGVALGIMLKARHPPEVNSALVALVETTRAQHEYQLEQLLPLPAKVNFQTQPELAALSTSESQLRQAEQQVYQQLLQSPDNTSLWEMWLWLHRQQIELQLNINQLSEKQIQQGAHI